MANPVWDGIPTYAFFTIALGAVDAKHSTSFNIPRAVQTVTFICPAVQTDATIALEGLDPRDKTTWTAVKSAAVTSASTFTFAPIILTSNAVTYTTYPASAIGTGTFRFVCATDQTTTTTPVSIIFDRMGSK